MARSAPRPSPSASATGSARRLDYIEGLRGFAVIAVLILHAGIWAAVNGNVTHYLVAGSLGVDLFFVISGFCMLWPALSSGTVRPVEPRRFYLRRLQRIAPPYYAAIVVLLLVSALVYHIQHQLWGAFGVAGSFEGTFPTTASHLAKGLLLHVTFLHGFSNQWDRGLDGAWWTLSVEWQFYALLPLLVYLCRRVSVPAVVIVMALVTLVFRDQVAASTIVAGDVLPNRLVEFGGGMLIAWLLATGRLKWVAHPAVAGVTLVTLVTAYVYYYHRPGTQSAFALWVLAFTLLIASPAAGGVAGRVFTFAPLRAVGRVSYSLYLIHGSVFMLLAGVLSLIGVAAPVRIFTIYVMGMPAAYLVALLMYRRIELPALAWSHRRRQSGGQRPPGLPAESVDVANV